MEILITILYIIACIALFSVAIAIHEFGHFIVALKLGLKVERFSIGFGPALFKKTWRGVEYRLSLIPLGGYVSIPDVDPEGTAKLEGADKPSAPRTRIPAWKELAVAVAGPAMNLVLAVGVAIGLSWVPSARFGEMPTIIGSVVKAGPAEKGGLLPGDRVMKVGEHAVSSWSAMQTEFQFCGTNATPVTVWRASENAGAGGEVVLSIAPEMDPITGACYILALSETNAAAKAAAWMPNRSPWRQLAWDAGAMFRTLKGLVTPKESKATAKALGGPVMIAEGIYRQLRHNVWDGIGFFRFLNVNLGVLNLLPIPVLDGGLILFALIALIFRRRVPDKVVGALSTGFMYLLLGLMAILIYRDGARTYRIHTAPSAAEKREMIESKIEKGTTDVHTHTDADAEAR